MLTALVAEVELEAGLREEAIARIDACLAKTAETLERYYDAPLLCLRAAALAERDAAEAEASLRRAIDTARGQSAQMFELQAATALARVLHGRGEVEAARAALRPVLEGLAEGSGGPVLRAAEAVLAALG
jgi:ATP/maltotriose-dependent transcriptional regulator MalT